MWKGSFYSYMKLSQNLQDYGLCNEGFFSSIAIIHFYAGHKSLSCY